VLLNGITTCGITNDVFTILRSYAQEQAKSTMTRSATYFSVQSHLEVNKVHLALFFRIAELFPQDDALVGGHDKIPETYFMQERFGKNDSIRDIHLPAIQPTIEASCRRANGGSASQD
jgi:hypothetical protein